MNPGWVGIWAGPTSRPSRSTATGGSQAVVQVPCPLWQGLDHLESAIDRRAAADPGRATRHAVTMTGELTDLFEDRAQGVQALVEFMVQRASPVRAIRVYAGACRLTGAGGGRWPPPPRSPRPTGWRAPLWPPPVSRRGSWWTCGSTTTDLVPFRGGRVIARGYADHERLSVGELVYSGVVADPGDGPGPARPLRRGLGSADGGALCDHRRPLPADRGTARARGPVAKCGRSAPRPRRPAPGGSPACLGSTGQPPTWPPGSGWPGFLAEVQLRTLADACGRLFSRGELARGRPHPGGRGRALPGAQPGRAAGARLPGLRVPLRWGAAGAAPDVADCAPAAAVARLAEAWRPHDRTTPPQVIETSATGRTARRCSRPWSIAPGPCSSTAADPTAPRAATTS